MALACKEELSNVIARKADALRAIDAVLPVRNEPPAAIRESTLSRTFPSAKTRVPVVRLVHSTCTTRCVAAPAIFTWRQTLRTVGPLPIDGVLVNVASIGGTELSEQILSRIKVMSELDIAGGACRRTGALKLPSMAGRSTSAFPSSRAFWRRRGLAHTR